MEIINLIVAISLYFTIIIIVGLIGGYLHDLWDFFKVKSPICWNPIKRINDVMDSVSANKTAHIVVWAVISIGVAHIVGAAFFSKPQVGAYFEKKTYQAQCYVYAYPDEDSDKCYKVPADIWRMNDGEKSRYFIGKIYFENGGSVDFEYDEYATVGEKESMRDSKGRKWEIELTKEMYDPI